MRPLTTIQTITNYRKVQVGKDQEKAQSEKDSHSNNPLQKPTPKTHSKMVYRVYNSLL